MGCMSVNTSGGAGGVGVKSVLDLFFVVYAAHPCYFLPIRTASRYRNPRLEHGILLLNIFTYQNISIQELLYSVPNFVGAQFGWCRIFLVPSLTGAQFSGAEFGRCRIRSVPNLLGAEFGRCRI